MLSKSLEDKEFSVKKISSLWDNQSQNDSIAVSFIIHIDRRQRLIVIKEGNILSCDGCIFHFIFTNSSQHSSRRKNQMFTRRTLNFALSSVPLSARLKVTTEISAEYPLFWALIVSIYITSWTSVIIVSHTYNTNGIFYKNEQIAYTQPIRVTTDQGLHLFHQRITANFRNVLRTSY